MNIYNTIYFIEYTKTPINYNNSKRWYLNLSKIKHFYKHRNFDLYSYIVRYVKIKKWHRYNKLHRLIDAASIYQGVYKDYYIRNYCVRTTVKKLHKYI